MHFQRISWWPTTPPSPSVSSVSPVLWTVCVKPWHCSSFIKDSVQMEHEEVFPSCLSVSHASLLHPPPPLLHVLPNEALCFSMWVSYRESQQPWAPIWVLVTLSDPQHAADFVVSLSLSQILAHSSSIKEHIKTQCTAKYINTHTHTRGLDYCCFRRWVGSFKLH